MDAVPHIRSDAWKPALLLFFLSPVCAELLTGSSPPAEFFHPPGLPLLILAYGGMAVLLRECALRWRITGWARLAMAIALGIYIEGIFCKSLLSPQWPDFDFPLGFGRLFGFNWTWAVGVLAFHAVQSFFIPWLIVDLAFPRQQDTPALGRVGLGLLALITAAVGAVGYFHMPMAPGLPPKVYHPPLLAGLLDWASVPLLIALAVWLSKRSRGKLPPACSAASPRPWLIGLLGTLAFVLFMIALPGLAIKKAHLPALGLFAAQLLLLASLLFVCARLTPLLRKAHYIAIATGIELLFILAAPLQELDNPHRPDDTRGMALVGLLALLALLAWHWRLRQLRGQQELVVARLQPGGQTDT